MALMLDMRKEFETMKQKNAKEIEALRTKNHMMKKRLGLGHTSIVDENVGGWCELILDLVIFRCDTLLRVEILAIYGENQRKILIGHKLNQMVK